MTKGAFYRFITLFCGLCVGLSACQQQAAVSPTPNAETQIAQSARQTLAARPSATSLPTATNTPLATATGTPKPTPVAVDIGPGNYPANVDPLTGLVAADPKILDRSPVMIKVANYPATGRPHAGLSSADIVFDYYIGEGGNRFMALFYGQDADKVGPIRSARYVDAQLVQMYQGLLGFAFADAKVFAKVMGALGDRGFVPSQGNCPAICDNGEGTVISVFSNTAKFTEMAAAKGVGNKRPDLQGLTFKLAQPDGGKPADDILVQFSNLNRGEWRYDAATGTYLRWIESVDANQKLTMVELTDRNTGKQLAFSNVIEVFATYVEYAPTLHDIMLTTNLAGQKAIMFRDGQAYEGTWKSAGATKPMQFFTSDGKPYALKPGNTWINLMGTKSEVKDDSGKWQIIFNLP